MIDEKKFNYTKQDIFGKYCKIPMYADGRKHMFKCIGVFQSNTYMDVPICPYHEMTRHHKEFNSLEDLEWVVNVIHCGIDETEVIRVALKDIEIIDEQPKVNEWIPVEERLPDKECLCLVTCEPYDDTKVIVITSYFYGYGEVFQGYREFPDGIWEANEIGYVLAWMPLPEPYKGANKDVD